MAQRLKRGLPVALTIAGSDSGGGAGIQADLLTFAARGVFGTTAITCLTAQNPREVTGVEAVSPEFLRKQLDAVAAYFDLSVIKTGMLFNVELVDTVHAFAEERPEVPLVVDPVMVATSGAMLLEAEAQAAMRRLLRRATIFTPNLDEAAVLLGWRPASPGDMERAAGELTASTGAALLLKGGHLQGDDLVDLLAVPGTPLKAIRHKRILNVNTHGSGCTLASALAAEVAKGSSLEAAVDSALGYLHAAMRRPMEVSGEHFIAHRA